MLSSDDLAQMIADLAAVRGDREESITVRRGGSEVGSLAVRLARIGGQSQERSGDSSHQSEARVVVLAAADADLQTGDRFNDANGVLYEVVFVRPNRDAATVAEARMVE